MNSNSKQSSIRVLGQRSIPSIFLSRSTNRSSDRVKNDEIRSTDSRVENEEIRSPNEEDSRVSLSKFLSGKLRKSSMQSGSLQGKEKQFASPFGGKLVSSTCDKGEIVGKDGKEARTELNHDIVLKHFKDSEKEQNDVCSSADIELTNNKEEVKKRTRGEGMKNNRKVLAVLGDDSQPLRRIKRKTEDRNEKELPLYNHYANGKGWWDDGMEGVDNEEVGSKETWEGLGTTTLGGIDWH